MSPGDTVNDVPTDLHHYVSMTIKELATLTIEHTCILVGTNVTLLVTDNVSFRFC